MAKTGLHLPLRSKGNRRQGARLEAPGGDDRAIRKELFSTQRLEQHALSLAQAQNVDIHSRGRKLLPRVRENTRVLVSVHAQISRATAEQRAITPAAEWLLDNFHVIEEQVHDIGVNLPESYYRGLPKLADGFLAGFPRVYGIAWALVAHTDSRFDPELLTLFVKTYQTVQPLTLGELWAIPVTLRVLLLENLRRLAVLVRNSQAGRRLADAFVDELEYAVDQTVRPLSEPVPGSLPSPVLRQSYAVQISQRLHDPHPGVAPPLDFLNDWLSEQGATLDEIVRLEHADQIAANTTVRNIITSMRAISAFDWRDFIERVSLVDACLRGHPGYGMMDFLTRDRYRHAIEDLARRSSYSELAIAQLAIAKFRASASEGAPEISVPDPGHYLIGDGRAAFEEEIGFRPLFRQRLLRAAMAHAGTAYPGGIEVLTTLLLLALPLGAGVAAGLGWFPLLIIGFCAVFPASDIATDLVNRAVVALLPPRHLPRLALAAGVPESLRTCVVVPTMFTSERGVEQQVEQMEVRYLANPDGAVTFALLSDWADADQEHMPGDAALLERAVAGVAALNAKYAQERFFVFHRRRRWNPSEGKWMGWERKRGKIHEFNRLLRGATDTSFLPTAERPLLAPAGVRYVITLDADTRLPIGAVAQLVGTAAHPLNRPVFDPVRRRVVAGYGILQPRVTPTLPLRGECSRFHRIFSGACGVDAYSSMVSEVYQDLFGLGTYTGKGLYDVDVFEASLAGRVPENTQLSHDLFESVFARCGLVSDLEFFEEFPSHTAVADSRSHRWTRGDWQLLPWIIGVRRLGAGRDMPFLGRWKMLDNLRRSLSAPGAFFTLIAAWAIPGAPQGMLVGFVLMALGMRAWLALGNLLVPPARGSQLSTHLRLAGQNVMLGLVQGFVDLVQLAHHAWLMIHAIGSTLIRVLITRRHLLRWVTALQAKSASRLGLQNLVGALGSSTGVMVAAGTVILLFNPTNLLSAAPFFLLWLSAPLVSHALSLPARLHRREALTPEDTLQLRLVGRRTWRFFTTFVTVEDHHLPPDNFQEDPHPVIAHRSSPTNFGLYLLSILAARDFGWIGLMDAVDRLEATLGTLTRMPRLHGHFYNWYDTQDLRALEPRYLSTVDSGNLASHLLTLAEGCREAARHAPDPAVAWTGLTDTHRLWSAALQAIGDARRTLSVSLDELHAEAHRFETLLAEAGDDRHVGEPLVKAAAILLDLARAYAAECGDDPVCQSMLEWCELLRDDVCSHARDTAELRKMPETPAGAPTEAGFAVLAARLDVIAEEAERLFREMDFGFLYDQERHLFALGYRVTEALLDDSYYDLLASEARLTSLVAIAKRDVKDTHWFHLGRRMTRAAGGNLLVSWSGSMFEYLMPSLVNFTPRYSLLDQSCRRAVDRQIQYGEEQGVPWGISESAFNQRDLELTYQYSAFGVPGLGLKRGLADDLVIAPYATALAAMYRPHAAARNYIHLEQLGGLGRYGFYEALDFTPARRAEGEAVAIVRCHMAHHQGMALVALDNVVHDGVMRHRFHRIPLIRSTDLLLQERSPPGADTRATRILEARAESKAIIQPPSRRVPSPTSAVPSSHLLSNGRYAVMVTGAGSGYSTWDNLAVTRWREDPTRDDRGSFIYLRDTATGRVWSAGYQPTAAVPDRYEVVFHEDRVRITRTDGPVESSLEILVSPEDDAEIRHLNLANQGDRVLEIELTSYAEIVLAPPRADIAHPAFSNLFVETEFVPTIHGLIARRRPRSAEDPRVWAAHLLSRFDTINGLQYETDRARFIGRGQTLRAPVAVMDGHPLGNRVGSVLDPIFSLRTLVRIEPGATALVTFTTLAADSREALDVLTDKYHHSAVFERVSALAWTHAQVQLHHLRITLDEAQLFQNLANHLVYSDPALRPPGKVMEINRLSVVGLWRHGISGDRPILLVRVTEPEHRTLVDQLLRAHEYWGLKRLAVDLVLLNEKGVTYAQELQDLLEGLVRNWRACNVHLGSAGRGAIFVLRADRLSDEDQLLLRTAARAILVTSQGTLAEQLLRNRRPAHDFVPRSALAPGPLPERPVTMPRSAALKPPRLSLYNGLGGFTEDGREYVILLDKGQWTPAPWINVIANPEFGFMVSETGGGCTWSRNSHENQLTPWSNDPVGDPPGEVMYLRDEDSGEVWTPTALPIRIDGATYIARHGQGYSRFEHASHEIHSELLQFVAPVDPVKISRLRLKNHSGHTRRLSVVAYVEWVLGTTRNVTAPYVVTEMDPGTGALFASNPWSQDFGTRIAFADLAGRQTSWTGSRGEFIGRNGDLAAPAALGSAEPAQVMGAFGRSRPRRLRNRTGAGLDPCAALETTVSLDPGETIDLVFLLGQGDDRAHAGELVERYRDADVETLLAEVRHQWDAVLGKIQITTPDPGLDLLMNRWLLYQTLSCRVWARAAFYQAGGAFGFRDQLQDVMALVMTRPEIARAHILRAAARQFIEGDVQHWWHPPTGRGVRTHFSDDRVWLPFVVAHYIRVSGEFSLLDEPVPFLEGPAVPPGMEDAYFEPAISSEQAPLREHCARALDLSLGVGVHGLPLIGGGDWNDGMNRVGHQGQGESLWLAWFLIATLTEFAELIESGSATPGERERTTRWREHAAALKIAVEAQGWDGAWYRRAYFDDGTPLGTAIDTECRIDSIAQSWGVISGAADPQRARRAMHSVHEDLIRHGDDLVLLFTPPFDKTPLDPGYIKGYLPGVRENGGQYTHAAIWSVIAYAMLGQGDQATELLRILNPINRTASRTGTHAYQVEPYVISADIYSEPPHARRGGWTWYTGASGWFHRAALEWVLGLTVRAGRLHIDPCVSANWASYGISYRHGQSRYEIVVTNPAGVERGVVALDLDGTNQPTGEGIELVDDGQVHQVRVELGRLGEMEDAG
ncbi:GH36-type glycosyl hydrolase domain-containing protein [Thiocapsa imhoffii]|uniref:GH36-type glycosyl hydrolase domain-containing protein n=1 Tax=Thiocapsa imhoffii TaxID=382777 RepID=UPI001905F2C5